MLSTQGAERVDYRIIDEGKKCKNVNKESGQSVGG